MSDFRNITWPYRIAGMVVLYHPDSDVIGNILSYLDDVEVLYVIDNSETSHQEIVSQICQLDRIVYMPNSDNLGIARALNIAAAKAIEEHYDFLLTMDQDSCACQGMIRSMLDCLRDRDISKIGLIGPFHLTEFDDNKDGSEECEAMAYMMTSGNLLNLKVYEIIGPFLDNFFIDQVDIEYCLRLIQNGYLVVRANSAKLKHSLGNITRIKFLGKQLRTSNHPPIRRYYMTRNRFFVWRKYRDLATASEAIARDKASFRGEIRNILLMEKDKLAKLAMIARGYLDYRRNIFGKYTG